MSSGRKLALNRINYLGELISHDCQRIRLSCLEVVEEFRRRLDGRHEQVVASAGAGDVEEMSFGVVDLCQIGVVGGGFDPLLERNDFVVAGHNGDDTELQAFGEVHCADGCVAFRRFQIFIENFESEPGLFHCIACAVQFRL